jgi:hypothetical protein
LQFANPRDPCGGEQQACISLVCNGLAIRHWVGTADDVEPNAMRTLLLFFFYGCLAVLMYCAKAVGWIISLLPRESGGHIKHHGWRDFQHRAGNFSSMTDNSLPSGDGAA